MVSRRRPRVSVIIPNRDNEPVLDHVLEQLAIRTTYEDFELVVVDDGSTDASRAILRRWQASGRFERMVYEEQPGQGVAAALNRGLALASGEVIVQMDGDASVQTTGWVELLLDLLLIDERVGAVTAKVVYDSGFIHACGVDLLGPEGYHDRGAQVLEPHGRRTYHQRARRVDEAQAPEAHAITEVDAGIGCCLMYRKADALAAGGYDPGFAPVWFDDLDLCVSLRRLGKKVFFTPEVRVVHHTGRRSTRASLARTPVERLVARAAHVTDRTLHPELRRTVGLRLGIDQPPREHWLRLQSHYAYWRRKWGWDMLNPDLAYVRERYAGTEICWRHEPESRRAGERIVAALRGARGAEDRHAAAGRAARHLQRFGFLPAPAWALDPSFATVLETVEGLGLAALGGDFVKVGLGLGGEVQQLAQLLAGAAPDRRVWAIDTDTSEDDAGPELASALTSPCPNVRRAGLDALGDLRVSFAHVTVASDPDAAIRLGELLWPRLVSSGVLVVAGDAGAEPLVERVLGALAGHRQFQGCETWTEGACAHLRRRA